jgi:NifB/MoaA-like Fe-S oxidoreductase
MNLQTTYPPEIGPDLSRRKQEDLEERREWRRKKDEEFMVKCAGPLPPHYTKLLHEDDKHVIGSEEAKLKATKRVEAIQSALAEAKIEKTVKEEQREAEGKARQAKAEERS